MPALTKLANFPEDRTPYGAVTAKQGESLKLTERISGNIERADSNFEKRALHDAAYFGALLLLDWRSLEAGTYQKDAASSQHPAIEQKTVLTDNGICVQRAAHRHRQGKLTSELSLLKLCRKHKMHLSAFVP